MYHWEAAVCRPHKCSGDTLYWPTWASIAPWSSSTLCMSLPSLQRLFPRSTHRHFHKHSLRAMACKALLLCVCGGWPWRKSTGSGPGGKMTGAAAWEEKGKKIFVTSTFQKAACCLAHSRPSIDTTWPLDWTTEVQSACTYSTNQLRCPCFCHPVATEAYPRTPHTQPHSWVHSSQYFHTQEHCLPHKAHSFWFMNVTKKNLSSGGSCHPDSGPHDTASFLPGT